MTSVCACLRQATASAAKRILARLARLKQVGPAAFHYGPVKPKRRCRFQGHAKRWQYGMRSRRPGADGRMSAGLPAGFGIKVLQAAGPGTGLVALNAYSRATSRCAKDFLAPLIEPVPFKILSRQIDGGSEFHDKFEQACAALDLPLLRCRLNSLNGTVAPGGTPMQPL